VKFKLIILFAALLLFAAIWSYETAKSSNGSIDRSVQSIKSAPPCVRLYDYLVKYSKEYGVPFQIAYGVARSESGYLGPFHWSYDPRQTSTANAYGAMQIQAPTASYIWKKKVTSKRLLNDLEFNVETSMKLLAYLHKLSGRWDVALGYYNTGRPVVNGYSIKIMKNYK
jgi:soluble lytic murein transglycosylase-like protein